MAQELTPKEKKEKARLDAIAFERERAENHVQIQKEINIPFVIDRSVFKKARVENVLLRKLKKANIAGRRQEYGSDYKRHLNTSVNSVAFPNGGHFTF